MFGCYEVGKFFVVIILWLGNLLGGIGIKIGYYLI